MFSPVVDATSGLERHRNGTETMISLTQLGDRMAASIASRTRARAASKGAVSPSMLKVMYRAKTQWPCTVATRERARGRA